MSSRERRDRATTVVSASHSDEGSPTVVTRAVGAVVAASAAVLAVTWFTLPVAGLGADGSSITLAQGTQGAYEDTGIALQCLLALVLGLAGVIRPAVGPGVVAVAALALPWALRFNVLALGSDRPAVLLLLTASTSALAVGIAVAVVLAGRDVVRRGLRPTGDQALVWALGVIGLATTAGLGWYRLKAVEGVAAAGAFRFDPEPQGAILGIGAWSGRGSVAGLVLAAVALGVAVVATGVTRRVGGWALVALLVTEAVRRGVLPAEDLSPFLVPDVITIELLPLGLLVPLLGAGVGAWLALGPDGLGAPDDGGDEPPDVRPDQDDAVGDLPDRPPTGPPAAWPTAGGT